MQAGDVQASAGVLADNRLATPNREALKMCRKQAVRAKKVVCCTIEVEKKV